MFPNERTNGHTNVFADPSELSQLHVWITSSDSECDGYPVVTSDESCESTSSSLPLCWSNSSITCRQGYQMKLIYIFCCNLYESKSLMQTLLKPKYECVAYLVCIELTMCITFVSLTLCVDELSMNQTYAVLKAPKVWGALRGRSALLSNVILIYRLPLISQVSC